MVFDGILFLLNSALLILACTEVAVVVVGSNLGLLRFFGLDSFRGERIFLSFLTWSVVGVVGCFGEIWVFCLLFEIWVFCLLFLV
jgi:hypothetical protein